ncbi:4-hydroxy-tetrahydrodipicolinate reductase [Bacillota bacterium]
MKIVIHGCGGRMGRILSEIITEQNEHTIPFGIDEQNAEGLAFPVYRTLYDAHEAADVIIDFSHYSAIKDLLGWCILNKKPLVIATTNLGEEEHRIIQEAAKHIPVFQSPNMSVGIHALCKALPSIVSALGEGFDAGIFEVHHKYKKDVPSGTAYLLKNCLDQNCRGVSALRIGSMPGEHRIIFAGQDEVLELTHTAYSRKIFALGALRAAAFIADKAPGLYSMDDLV